MTGLFSRDNACSLDEPFVLAKFLHNGNLIHYQIMYKKDRKRKKKDNNNDNSDNNN